MPNCRPFEFVSINCVHHNINNRIRCSIVPSSSYFRNFRKRYWSTIHHHHLKLLQEIPQWPWAYSQNKNRWRLLSGLKQRKHFQEIHQNLLMFHITKKANGISVPQTHIKCLICIPERWSSEIGSRPRCLNYCQTYLFRFFHSTSIDFLNVTLLFKPWSIAFYGDRI